MPIVMVNGIKMNYDEYGAGEPVLLIAGMAEKGRIWTQHQVPALTGAGYRVITFDNRGIPPTDECLEGFTMADMVSDTADLIRVLGIGPCRALGYSMGAVVLQELALAHPELVTRAVLMATRGRTDTIHAARIAGDSELLASGVVLPPSFASVVQAMRLLSHKTHSQESSMRDWLDIFELSPPDSFVNRAQIGVDAIDNRLGQYRNITTPCLVIGFQDDLVAAPHLGREVAESIPDGRFTEIPDCGHLGYLEEPATVNSIVLDFFS